MALMGSITMGLCRYRSGDQKQMGLRKSALLVLQKCMHLIVTPLKGPKIQKALESSPRTLGLMKAGSTMGSLTRF